jgi:hypothetical protein
MRSTIILSECPGPPSPRRMNTARSSSKRRIVAKLLLVLFGILIGAVVAEVSLRIVGYSFPEFYQPDGSRGYALRPGMEGWYRKEGESYVRINSDGLRDREHSKTKPPNTFRIAVLGDSYPEALQVPVEDAFWMVMQPKLQTCGALRDKQIEVLNFGVSGYGTAQELITLREHVWDYSPDLVVLTVTTNNDITDNSRALKRTDQVPYFVYQNEKLTLDDSFKNTRTFRLQNSIWASVGRWFRDHLRLIQAIGEGHRALRVYTAGWRARLKTTNALQATDNAKDKEDLIARSKELGADNLVYLETDDPVWKEAWAVTEGLIKLMRDEVQAKGSRFVVVTLSNGPQVFPDEKVRQEFMKRFLVRDLFYPDMRIKNLCDRERIPVLTLAPELQEYAARNHVFLHGFEKTPGTGHWNQTGHQIAGELLAEKLCSMGVLH